MQFNHARHRYAQALRAGVRVKFAAKLYLLYYAGANERSNKEMRRLRKS